MIGESLAVARRSLAAASANVSWIGAMAPMPAVATRSKPGPRYRVSDEEIVAAYHATTSTHQAARMAGVGADWMRERLSRLGLKSKGVRPIQLATDVELTAAYHATSSTKDAALAVGLSLCRASVRLCKLGLPAKGRPGRRRKVSP